MTTSFLLDDDQTTYSVMPVAGCPGTWAVATSDELGTVIGGFEATTEDQAQLEEEALLVIREATAR